MIGRIAVVTLANLNAGEAANVAALLCGQVSRTDGLFFSTETVVDQDGLHHVAPRFSVVILKAKNPSQLYKLASEYNGAICFSRDVQRFNNAFPEYKQFIANSTASTADIIGVAVYGEDGAVRALTRKFSLLT